MKILEFFNFLFQRVYAQDAVHAGPIFENPLNAQSVQELVVAILKLVYQVGLPLIIVMFIYAGFLYVSARGNSTKITAAHEAMKYTIIGAAIVLGASVIAAIIQGTIDSLAK